MAHVSILYIRGPIPYYYYNGHVYSTLTLNTVNNRDPTGENVF